MVDPGWCFGLRINNKKNEPLVRIYSSILALPFKKLRMLPIHLSNISKEIYCTYSTQSNNIGSSGYKRVDCPQIYGLNLAGCGNDDTGDSKRMREGR